MVWYSVGLVVGSSAGGGSVWLVGFAGLGYFWILYSAIFFVWVCPVFMSEVTIDYPGQCKII